MDREKYRGRYRIETARLRGHDYAAAGWYFVTICTKGRACTFGAVAGGRVRHSAVGRVAHRYCAAIPAHTDRAVLDAFVVMPNHVHALIGLLPRDDKRDDAERTAHDERTVETCQWRVSTPRNEPPPKNQQMSAITPDAGSLGIIVNQYKGAVMRWGRKNGFPHFAWQPRFWDRVVRDRREFLNVRRYILANPSNWECDRHHPSTPPLDETPPPNETPPNET